MTFANKNGIIGFKLDFHNLKKVDYEDFLEVCGDSVG